MVTSQAVLALPKFLILVELWGGHLSSLRFPVPTPCPMTLIDLIFIMNSMQTCNSVTFYFITKNDCNSFATGGLQRASRPPAAWSSALRATLARTRKSVLKSWQVYVQALVRTCHRLPYSPISCQDDSQLYHVHSVLWLHGLTFYPNSVSCFFFFFFA